MRPHKDKRPLGPSQKRSRLLVRACAPRRTPINDPAAGGGARLVANCALHNLALTVPDMVEGATHAGRSAEDAARAADLRRHGWIVIRVAVGDQRSIRELLSALRAAFGKRGYTW